MRSRNIGLTTYYYKFVIRGLCDNAYNFLTDTINKSINWSPVKKIVGNNKPIISRFSLQWRNIWQFYRLFWGEQRIAWLDLLRELDPTLREFMTHLRNPEGRICSDEKQSHILKYYFWAIYFRDIYNPHLEIAIFQSKKTVIARSKLANQTFLIWPHSINNRGTRS